MPIVGFNFSKMSIERKGMPKGKININNNAAIKKASPADLFLGKNKQKGVRFDFEFTSSYTPDIAEIVINGEILWMGDAKEVEEILATWEKGSQLKKELLTDLLNVTFMRCTVEALVMSRDFNLPPPIEIPKIDKSTQLDKEDYIG